MDCGNFLSGLGFRKFAEQSVSRTEFAGPHPRKMGTHVTFFVTPAPSKICAPRYNPSKRGFGTPF